jgi:hypothetical protein
MSEKKPSELSQLTKSTYETVREQLRKTTETIDRRTDELRARVAARRAGQQSQRRVSLPDLDLGAGALKGR